MGRSRSVCCAVAFGFVISCVFVTPASGRDCPSFGGLVPGNVSAVEVSGQNAFFGNGSALVIADVSDPWEPRTVGSIWFRNVSHDVVNPVVAVEVSGDYAYALVKRFCLPEGGCRTNLYVLDVSTPSSPEEVASLAVGSGVALEVADNFAYIATYEPSSASNGSLRVIDVSDPMEPVEVGFNALNSPSVGHPLAMAVSGSRLFLITSGHWPEQECLLTMDVSDPTQPTEVSYFEVEGARDVAVSGDFAFVAEPEGLRVFDLNVVPDPWYTTNEVGFLRVWGGVVAVKVVGHLAYLMASDGLRVVDVFTPSLPAEIGFVEGVADSIEVSGGYAYEAGGLGLRVIDVRVPTNPTEAGSLDAMFPHVISISDNYAYVQSHDDLHILDISRPSTPVKVGTIENTFSDHSDLAVSGDYIYTANNWEDSRVIDVGIPSEPLEIATIPVPGRGFGVAVSDGYAYFASQPDNGLGSLNGLAVFDVSIPSTPLMVGSIETPGFPVGVALSGSYTYVAAGDSLRVIDVSTPTAPIEVGSLEVPCLAIDVAGTLIIVSDGTSLSVIDVSAPDNPVEVGAFVSPLWYGGGWSAISVSDGLAYVAHQGWDATFNEYSIALRVIDIRNPTNPAEIGVFETSTVAPWDPSQLGVAVAGNDVFFAAEWGGLQIFDASGCTCPYELPPITPPEIE